MYFAFEKPSPISELNLQFRFCVQRNVSTPSPQNLGHKTQDTEFIHNYILINKLYLKFTKSAQLCESIDKKETLLQIFKI